MTGSKKNRPRDLGRQLKQLSEAIEREVNNARRPRGITMSQMTVLWELYRNEAGECSFKEIERALGVAQSTASGLVARLESKDYVVVQCSQEDARSKRVRITPAGVRLCDDVRAEMAAHDERLRQPLTDAEYAQLVSLLQRVYESFVSEG